VLTTFGADDHVVRSLVAGAAGFLLKDTRPADIVEAVRRVAAGEPMLSPAVVATLIERVKKQQEPGRSARARERLDRLTDREREIAEAVARGLSNAQIASELYLSVPTVKARHLFAGASRPFCGDPAVPDVEPALPARSVSPGRRTPTRTPGRRPASGRGRPASRGR
jgi:FixJ family two-component response regulator